MAKAVFRPGEIILSDTKVILDSPQAYAELPLVPQEETAEAHEIPEEYTGPTADDLRREAELFKSQWNVEREAMIRSARVEAERIIKEAEEEAARENRRKAEEAETIKPRAEAEAERIIAEARVKAEEIGAGAQAAFDAGRAEAIEQGRLAGREEGFNEGKAEADRLIERIHRVLERAQNKREEILAETEQQIIDLVLLITRKVVKIISENQRDVVISNIVQALRKVKGRGAIFIRVNLADLKLSTEHTKNFIQLAEGAGNIQIVEDSTVDPGGCIIETDFGEIDARISSQLAELETRILAMSPLRGRAKPAPPREGS
ncbi:MAG: flagellar assembly protein FliH [Spirochaetaceae bacterium]|jgi:flagellar assembly protein FliH|nr:flagellar assembly protein FliH [Spirochaetaceae bacterium]